MLDQFSSARPGDPKGGVSQCRDPDEKAPQFIAADTTSRSETYDLGPGIRRDERIPAMAER
jgi:hypothetical protein